MKKSIFFTVLAAAAFLSVGLPLEAKEYDNVLLYRKCGSWNHNGTLIDAGTDEGRITWDGKPLRFTPRGDDGFDLWKFLCFDFSPSEGTFDLQNFYSFGFAIRVPENMRDKPITVKFVYEEGKPSVWTLRTPPHTGWRSSVLKVNADKWPHLRPDKLKSVEFSSEVPGFQAWLDDIRFVRAGLDFQLHEEWLPPLTNGCFFPEYTLEQQRKETLNDPDFQVKMAAIEKLRPLKMKIRLKPMHSDPKELLGNALIARIKPDGSIEGYSYEEVKKIHKQRRTWHDLNETYFELHCVFFNQLLSYWEWGRLPRTEENRRKLVKGLTRALIAETNRRHEVRHIVPAFMVPKTACLFYRTFFDDMDAVEKGTNTDPDLILLNRLLKEASSWCYFHTFYKTIAPTLTLDSFRHNSDWTGGNFSYRPTFWAALICRNPKMLDVISGVAKGSLSITSYNTMNDAFWFDGMTADGSAWGHRNQNYPVGYPMDGFIGIGEMIGNLTGSCWALKTDGPAFDHICNYSEALLWHGTGWAPTKDSRCETGEILQRDIPVASGRIGQIYREGKGYSEFGRAFMMVKNFCDLAPAGSVQKKRLRYCLDVMLGKKRELPVGCRYFWNNDLLLCREKESLAAVSMLSSRVLSIEAAPSSSHFTDFWSDGAAWIMKHFDSYRVARGFMKPYAIPGVTSRQWDFTHETTSWRSYAGLHNFAGGAADGSYAVCGYKMGRKPLPSSPDPNFYDLDAEKSYFWLNGKLICIGTGITDRSHRNVPVATTVDQTLWRGPAQDGTGTVRNPDEAFQAESQLLWHDGVGYAVLNGRGKLSGETRKDRWIDFDRANRKAKNLPKSAPILMFQIDHGKNPQNGSYAYAVDFHSPDFAALKKMAEQPPFEIVSVTSGAHAVREKSSGTLAAVFFKPGEAGGLKVDAPAVVLLRQTSNGVRVTVSDPEQDPKRDSVTLNWNGETYRIPLPTGVYCGQPVTVDLSGQKL